MRSVPEAAACVIVTLAETERASVGTPHTPERVKSRTPWPERLGAPSGPAAFRVSMARQGESVWNKEAESPASVNCTTPAPVAVVEPAAFWVTVTVTPADVTAYRAPGTRPAS